MAKKVKIEEQNGKLIATPVYSEIEKKFGEGILITGRQLVDNPKEIISVSPVIDEMLGGGIPVGTTGVFVGQPRCGKTTTVLCIAAKWQQRGKRVVYLNAEHRLEEKNLSIPGLNIDEFIIEQSRKGKILSAQDYLNTALQWLRDSTDTLVILDSLSILLDQREMEGGIGTETRGSVGKLLSAFCKQISSIVSVNDNMFLGISHLYCNTGGGNKTYYESSGSKIQYQLTTKLYCTHHEPWTIASDKEGEKIQIGQQVHWKAERTSLRALPNTKGTSFIRYGLGIDEIHENIETAKGIKLIDLSGAWYTLSFMGDDAKKVQGGEGLWHFLRENPDIYNRMQGEIKRLC